MQGSRTGTSRSRVFELPAFGVAEAPASGQGGGGRAGRGARGPRDRAEPGDPESKRERARSDAALRAQHERQEIAQIRHEQRPRFARGAPAGRDVAARERLVASAAASIKADAGTRSAAASSMGRSARQVRALPAGRRDRGGRPAPVEGHRAVHMPGRDQRHPGHGRQPQGCGRPDLPHQDRLPQRAVRLLQDPRPARRELAVRADALVALPNVCGGVGPQAARVDPPRDRQRALSQRPHACTSQSAHPRRATDVVGQACEAASRAGA